MGDVSQIAEVQGSGGGYNLGGAILGGLLFGDAGAIIGSRNQIEISTANKTVDSRYIQIRYYDENGRLIMLNLPYACYFTLTQILPDKEKAVVDM